jgi:hypothetical protein
MEHCLRGGARRIRALPTLHASHHLLRHQMSARSSRAPATWDMGTWPRRLSGAAATAVSTVYSVHLPVALRNPGRDVPGGARMEPIGVSMRRPSRKEELRVWSDIEDVWLYSGPGGAGPMRCSEARARWSSDVAGQATRVLQEKANDPPDRALRGRSPSASWWSQRRKRARTGRHRRSVERLLVR